MSSHVPVRAAGLNLRPRSYPVRLGNRFTVVVLLCLSCLKFWKESAYHGDKFAVDDDGLVIWGCFFLKRRFCKRCRKLRCEGDELMVARRRRCDVHFYEEHKSSRSPCFLIGPRCVLLKLPNLLRNDGNHQQPRPRHHDSSVRRPSALRPAAQKSDDYNSCNSSSTVPVLC